MARTPGETVKIKPELAVMMHKRMLENAVVSERPMNYQQLAESINSHHSTISRLIGPDKAGKWTKPRPVMEPILLHLLKVLRIPSDEALQHVVRGRSRGAKLDDAERKALEFFRRIKMSNAPGAVEATLAELAKRAEAAEQYMATFHQHGSIPPSRD